jgi:tetratricopeptide (TPR) repeat protein
MLNAPAERAGARLRRLAAAGVIAAALGGCAAVQTERLRSATPADLPRHAELAGTPFFPQTEYQCGPAALATALAGLGLAADPARLAEQVFLPARTGTLQIEMVAGARRQGAVATRIPATLEAALREISMGRPVVVLQNLGLSWYPAWHYAVLVGHDLDAGDVLLRSGTTEREVLPMKTFEHTWVRAGAWGIVLTRPGDWPATATEGAIVEAAVGFERAAPPADAVLAYRGALRRFSSNLSLQMGLGNALYAAGDKPGAAEAFRRAAQDHPAEAVPQINLSATLLDLGDRAGATTAARAALARAGTAWAEPARAALEAAERASR